MKIRSTLAMNRRPSGRNRWIEPLFCREMGGITSAPVSRSITWTRSVRASWTAANLPSALSATMFPGSTVKELPLADTSEPVSTFHTLT